MLSWSILLDPVSGMLARPGRGGLACCYTASVERATAHTEGRKGEGSEMGMPEGVCSAG